MQLICRGNQSEGFAEMQEVHTCRKRRAAIGIATLPPELPFKAERYELFNTLLLIRSAAGNGRPDPLSLCWVTSAQGMRSQYATIDAASVVCQTTVCRAAKPSKMLAPGAASTASIASARAAPASSAASLWGVQLIPRRLSSACWYCSASI